MFELVFDLEENGCGMTYMYEYPEYINIDMPDHIQEVSWKLFADYLTLKLMYVLDEVSFSKYFPP